MGIEGTHFRSSIGQDLQDSHDLLLSQFPDETEKRQSASPSHSQAKASRAGRRRGHRE